MNEVVVKRGFVLCSLSHQKEQSWRADEAERSLARSQELESSDASSTPPHNPSPPLLLPAHSVSFYPPRPPAATHRYSNMICTATNKHAAATIINLIPALHQFPSTKAQGKRRTLPAPNHLPPHVAHPLRPNREPDQIRCHHHEDIEHSSDRRKVPVPRSPPILHAISLRQKEERGGKPHLLVRNEFARAHLGKDEEGDDPAPSEEFKREVMPQRDERKHDQRRPNGVRAAKRDVEVPSASISASGEKGERGTDRTTQRL